MNTATAITASLCIIPRAYQKRRRATGQPSVVVQLKAEMTLGDSNLHLRSDSAACYPFYYSVGAKTPTLTIYILERLLGNPLEKLSYLVRPDERFQNTKIDVA